MRRAALLALALLLAALIPHAPRATTAHLVRVSCPVCSKDFADIQVLSYFHAGSRERDLSDMPFASQKSLTTCPHCLYSALDSRFAEGTPALRDRLETLAERLDPEAVRQRNGDVTGLCLLIAEDCAIARKADLKERASLQMQAYCAAKRAKDAPRQERERARLLAALKEALEQKAFKGADIALFTYLRGELLRLSGDLPAALKEFDHARKLARWLPDGEKGADNPRWIEAWAREQILRIEYAEKSVAELDALCAAGGSARTQALLTLSERKDPAAWAVIFKQVAKKPERLMELDEFVKLTRETLRLHPEFWTWAAEQYRTARTPEGTDPQVRVLLQYRNRFAHLFDDERNTWTPRLEHAKDLAAALRGQKAGADEGVVFPEGWDERMTLRHLPLAIQSGEAVAIDFFLRWADRIHNERAGEFSYEIKTVLDALPPPPARTAALARVLQTDPDSGTYGRRVLNAALRMLAGDKRAPERLLDLLHEEDARGEHWEIAARAFCIAGNPGLKPDLLPRMKGDMRRRVLVAFWETYARFGTPEDIPALEAFIATIPLRKAGVADEDVDREFGVALHERHEVEQTLLELKLGKLAAECAKRK